MANTSSAKKMVRKIARRTAVNKARRTRVRTYVKKVELAITSGDQAAAKTALVKAESELMRAVGKGIYHKSTGSRKVSRLSARVKAMSA
jgi:small subunit ribosomal protein S20